MTDIGLLWDPRAGSADIAVADGQLVSDDGLKTAILISLFTDARARADDALPAPEDKRGWWGDAFAVDQDDVIGSRLWLLAREKMLPVVVSRAREYVVEATQWLIDDGITPTVVVMAEAQSPDLLAISVETMRPTGPGRQRFDFVWDAITGAGYAL